MAEIPAPGALPGGCLYEPKWDGFRIAIAREGDAGVTLWSRQGTDLTARFPEVAAAAGEQLPDGCVLDGELVIWTEDRLDFDALQRRLARGVRAAATLARQHPASFVGFDVLAVGGQDARAAALRDRRALLDELALGWSPPLHVSPSTSDAAEARAWFDELAPAGIEGVMAKALGQPYVGGERAWLKVKRRETVDVIVGAVTGPLNRPETIVVGLPVDGTLRIVGRSTPLSSRAAVALAHVLQEPSGDHPWPAVVKPGAIDRFRASKEPVLLTLVEPIVAEVSVDMATSGGSFRHAVRFVRARPDLDPTEVPERT